MLPLHTTAKSNSVASPGEYVGNFDYLLQHGAYVYIDNVMRYVVHYGKTSFINRKYITYCIVL